MKSDTIEGWEIEFFKKFISPKLRRTKSVVAMREELKAFIRELLVRAREEGRNEAADWIEEHSRFDDDPKDTMIIYEQAREI